MLGSGGTDEFPPFLVRRDASANEIHIIFTAPPYGGAIIRGSQLERVNDVEGHWVRDLSGHLITRVSGEQIPLFLCQAFAKRSTLEEDWSEVAILGATLQDAPPSGENSTRSSHNPFRYCFSADPSGSAFVGVQFRGCAFEGVYTTLTGTVHHGAPFSYFAKAIGYCEGEVAVADWHVEDGALEPNGLEIQFFRSTEFDKAKITRAVTVRNPVLRRPVEVVDMDPHCRYLLLAKPSTHFSAARWYTLDLVTGAVARVGTGSGFGVFLRKEVATLAGDRARH